MNPNCFELIGRTLVPGIPVYRPNPMMPATFIDLGQEGQAHKIRMVVWCSGDGCFEVIKKSRVMRAMPAVSPEAKLLVNPKGFEGYIVCFDVERLLFNGVPVKGLWSGGEYDPLRPLWREAKNPVPPELHIMKVPTFQGWALPFGKKLFVFDINGAFMLLEATTDALSLMKPLPSMLSEYVLARGMAAKVRSDYFVLGWAKRTLGKLTKTFPRDWEVARHFREISAPQVTS